MQLGSSIRRRRGKGGRGGGGAPEGGARPASAAGPRRGLRLFGAALVVMGVGLGTGWLVATRVLFPPPPPPGDLYEVPDVYALAGDEARQRVLAAGLQVGEVDAFRHPAVDSGAVVGQDPLPGQLAEPGDSVRLSLSLGVEMRAVPTVMQLRADRARLVLETSGFEVTVDSVQSPQPRGRVISLDPTSGTLVAMPGQVRLTVSVGPPQVAMPLVIGMEEAVARDSLQALGFLLGDVGEAYGFDAEGGRVVGQDPPAGRMMELGSAVRIVIGRGGVPADTTGSQPPADTLRAPGRRR